MLNLNEATTRLLAGPEVTTLYLYDIFYQGTDSEPLRWSNWDEELVFDGQTYLPQTIKHNELEQGTDGKINDVTLSIGNADRQVQYYIEQYDLIGKVVRITQIFLDGDGAILGHINISFRIKAAKATKTQADFTLSIGLDFLQSKAPCRRMFSRFCGHQFKDIGCGYQGTDTACTKLFNDCVRKGNQQRFGGFPAILTERFYF